MRLRPVTGLALLLLGLGVAASAILGPLVLDVISFRISANMENQLMGGELVSLYLMAPLAAAAGVLWLRRHRLAPVLAIGPALYGLYTYVQFVLVPEYDRYDGNNEYFFPLYLALVILSWVVVLEAWRALGLVTLPSPRDGLRRALAALLIVLNVIVVLAWAGTVIGVVTGGAGLQEYQEHPTAFWLIRLMDLAFVVPAAFITGVGLLRRTSWATRLAYGFTGFQTLLAGAVAAMAMLMKWRGDPSASSVLLVVMTTFTVVLAAVFILLLRPLAAARHTRSSVSG